MRPSGNLDGNGPLYRPVSRRGFLEAATTIAVAAPLLAHPIIPGVRNLDMDGDPRLRAEARLPLEGFLEHYAGLIRERRIRIGCSFSPESLGVDGPRVGERGKARALRVLQAAVEDLGMADIRLGLRWSNLAPNGADLTTFYAPYLDYCFRNASVRTVALDFGPLKTFRWPEIHVPQPVLDGLDSVPGDTAEIRPQMAVAQRGLEHLGRAVAFVGQEYDGAKPVTISLNEPFHGFGRFSWTMSEAYLLEVLDVVLGSGHFADAGVLVNSAQGLDLHRIAAFFQQLVRQRPELRGRLTSGFDIYPFLPPMSHFPVLKQLLGNIRAHKRDWSQQVGPNLEWAHDPEAGYRIEVTEAQAEPFGDHPLVGNSLPHFQHVLAECFDKILDPDQDESLIRLFGIEYQLRLQLSGRAAPDNLAILELTRRINELGAR
ncbi:MAG: hypothetical protein K1X87_00220 [Dehalococcoidia bacterium]|nr:hypothetical protein [Dehalococcoidia bacterium]